MRWIYAEIGEPLWEWTVLQAEQSVMFYDAEGPAHEPPPMSDKDWLRLQQSLKREENNK